MLMYRDEIWLIHDDDSEEKIWENSPRENQYGYDDAPDSEYNKMMELHSKYDFADWENAPNFEHRTIEITPNGEEKVIDYEDLVNEYINMNNMKSEEEICKFIDQVRFMSFEQSHQMCCELLTEMGATSKETALNIAECVRHDFRIAYDYQVQYANVENVYLYDDGTNQIFMGDIDSHGDLNPDEEKDCNLEEMLIINWVNMLEAINSSRES